jgi:two-component system cell cycle sensor histidine kinase/response regulator CckA
MGRRSMAKWVGRLAMVPLVLTTFGIVLDICRIGRPTLSWSAEAASIAALALAGVVAGVIRKALIAVEARIEILSWVFDSSPDAQLIVTPSGRVHFANRAFCEVFPGSVGSPLDRVRRALSPDPETAAQFHRFRGRVAAGAPASATLPLSGTPTGVDGLFKFRTGPVANHPEYSYWKVQNVSAATQSETALRDECNMLASLLDNAPVGFYSVDEVGRFRYVNRTLAQWLGITPAEMLASGTRLPDFLASPPPGAPLWSPFPRQNVGAQRGEVALKTRQGQVVPAWIGQNVVGSGAGLRTTSVVCDLTPERG